MPLPGRPKALDDENQKTICSLLAAGASLRQAAHFVDCDPQSIRREAERNDEFRRQLAKAKSEANIEPLETLRHAAKNDWRAALSWMERIDPDRFARPDASIVTKREANLFVADLIESIERAISNPRERKDLFELLAPAMPAAMRRRWNGHAMRRAVEQMKSELDKTQWNERRDRDDRRIAVFLKIADYLPEELRYMLLKNKDLLDPEEVFAQDSQPAASPMSTPASPHDSTNFAPSSDDAMNNASLASNNASPPRRNSDAT
jgi:hypothetical protein